MGLKSFLFDRLFYHTDETTATERPGPFGMLMHCFPDRSEKYIIGPYEELKKYAAAYPNEELHKDNVIIFEGKEGDFLLFCEKARGDNFQMVFCRSYNLDSYGNEERIKSFLTCENPVIVFAVKNALYYRPQTEIPEIQSCVSFGESNFPLDYKTSDLLEQTRNHYRYFCRKKLEFQAKLDSDEENLSEKEILGLKKLIKDIEAQISKDEETYTAWMLEEVVESIKRLRIEENKYQLGMIHYWETMHEKVKSPMALYFSEDESVIYFTDEQGILPLIKAAIQNAKKRNFNVRRCAYCYQTIYTENTKGQSFCSDKCRREYRTDYDRAHRASYKIVNPADTIYDTTCKYMRRHIESTENIERKELLSTAYKEFRSKAKLRKKAVNQEGTKKAIDEFRTYCLHMEDAFVKIEDGYEFNLGEAFKGLFPNEEI